MAGETGVRRALFDGTISTLWKLFNPLPREPRPREEAGREVAREACVPRALFDGAISTAFPARFQDVINIRDVPEDQEVFVDLARDESLNFDLTGLIGFIGGAVGEASRALWHLRMIAGEQDAGDSLVVENSGTLELAALRLGEAPAVAGTSVGKLAITKVRRGKKVENIVRLYLASIRLENARTDVLITAYEPLSRTIDPWLEGATAVAAIPAEQAGCLPMS